MSPLARRSALVLALLFGLVFAVGTAVLWFLQQPLWIAVVFAVGMVTLQFALGPAIIGMIFRIRWTAPSAVSPEFAAWYDDACRKRRIPAARFGIIDDGNPNAFTYGHVPADARIVVTSGLVEMLSPEELHAVVAHEMGHIAHYDFIVMTAAQVVPLILYQFYIWIRGNGSVRGAFGLYAVPVGIGAYVAYLVSQYVVLGLSRVREYFADDASAHLTGDPNALSRALVKIAYGLAPNAGESAEPAKKDKAKTALRRGATVAAMGISNIASAPGFAVTATDAGGSFSAPAMARAMRWDFQNPWAKWYDLASTHPLTARRIRAMNASARRMNIPPAYDLSEAERPTGKSYSGFFPAEFVIFILPYLAGFLGYMAPQGAYLGGASHSRFMMAAAFAGLGWLIKLVVVYPRGSGAKRTVEELVGGEINASGVCPVPCAVEGELIGRGVPGLFWSSNLVVRDETGFMMVQYRQPLRVLEILFGVFKAESYFHRPVRVHGWYRRAPVPYIEMKTIEMLDGSGMSARSYYLPWAFLMAAALTVLGFLAPSVLAAFRAF
jgi:heat shock protein HtpX